MNLNNWLHNARTRATVSRARLLVALIAGVVVGVLSLAVLLGWHFPVLIALVGGLLIGLSFAASALHKMIRRLNRLVGRIAYLSMPAWLAVFGLCLIAVGGAPVFGFATFVVALGLSAGYFFTDRRFDRQVELENAYPPVLP
ncbi:MAG TPA: hypothetical protein VH144_01875 [Candidatus Saccharimonadales bacterium]|jgi:O-antigen/teichoic acid export membrane protein|nr:hypothetical protein [Candidatus Saccharimonadales bacterium]